MDLAQVHVQTFSFKEAILLLMLCASSNHLWPFSYRMQKADFEHSCVLSIFS